MRKLDLFIISVTIIAAFFMFTGCGGNGAILSQMSGTWKSAKNGAAVKINLSGDKKVIEFDGKTIPVSVKKIDESACSVHLDAQLPDGKTSKWLLKQMWDNNGSSFTLRFDHNGEEETLTHA